MEGLFSMFKKFFVSTTNVKGGGEFPYYVEIDSVAWEEYRAQNSEATLKDFIREYGVKRMLCAGQTIPEGFIGVEAGSAIKLRL